MNSQLNIVFLDCDSLGSINLDPIAELGQIQTFNTTEDLPESVFSQADIFITNKVPLGEAELTRAKRLKLICVAATGYNNIDLAAAERHQVKVCNVAGYSTQSVAQHVFALLLNWAGKITENQRASQDGRWQLSPLFCLLDQPSFELAGKTFGIIGYGEIGQATAKLAEAFAMKVIIAERPGTAENKLRAGRVPFEQLVQQADIISLHCPLTADNQAMVDAEFLGKMKKDAILINTARGGLVDEQALATALANKQIQAALLDSLAIEPPAADNPLLKPLDNLSITPHIAWASQQARQRLLKQIALNIAAFMQGKARNSLV